MHSQTPIPHLKASHNLFETSHNSPIVSTFGYHIQGLTNVKYSLQENLKRRGPTLSKTTQKTEYEPKLFRSLYSRNVPGIA